VRLTTAISITTTLVLASLIACGEQNHEHPDGGALDAAPDAASGCAIDGDQRASLRDLSTLWLATGLAQWSASGVGERGAALGVLGGFGTPTTFIDLPECSAARPLDGPTCEPMGGVGPFGAAQGCFRLGCEADRIGLVEVYIAPDADTDPEHEAPLTYRSGMATVTYDPNPRVIWRVDVREEIAVSADLAASVAVALPGGAVVDASHSGHLEVTGGEDLAEASLELAFPGLATDVALALGGAEHDLSGTVTAADGSVLASVSVPGAGAHGQIYRAPFAWVDACAGGDELPGCSQSEQIGDTVAEMAVTDPLPTGHGGTIAAGTYALVETTVYGQPTSGPTGNQIRTTLVLGDGAIEGVTSRNEGPDDAFTATYTTDDAAFEMHLTCPFEGDAPPVTFDATPNAFTILDPDSMQEQRYERR